MSHYSKKILGFSLIELLVSIGVMSVIFTVVILNQSKYTDGIALTNLADEISSMISQAQVYGTGVKELSTGSGEFNASYGLTFSLLGTTPPLDPNSGSASAYLYFADRNGNNRYDGDWSCPTGDASECLSRIDITRGNVIEDLCEVRTSGLDDQCGNSVRRVDIIFVRPSTEARLTFFNNGGQSSSQQPTTKVARVKLRSPSGSTRSVVVYNTGQISVE